METHVTEQKLDVYSSVRVTPLVDILDVTIHCDDYYLLNDGKQCEIYGRIIITNKLDHKTFRIYNRRKENPQSISFGDPLFLTSPLNAQNTAIIPAGDVTVSVALYDKARHDMLVAQGKFTLGRSAKEDWLEDYQVQLVSGDNNLSVKVRYAVFPYAVTATVSILFFSKDDPFDTFTDTGCFVKENWDKNRDTDCLVETCDEYDEYGEAEYEKNDCLTIAHLFGTVSASCAVNGTPSLLFSKTIENSLKVKSGEFIELSKSVIVVPAYSSLKIAAAFFDASTQSSIASGTVALKPHHDWTCKKDITGDNGRIRVRVIWRDAHKQLHRYSSLDQTRLSTSEILDNGNKGAVKRNKQLSNCHSSAALIDNCLFRPHISSEALSSNCILPSCFPSPLVEVFSVVVCSKDLNPFKFYGSMIVSYGHRYKIFDRDTSCPQDCPNSGTLVIMKGGCCSFTSVTEFDLLLDLKDVNGAVVSNGFLACRDLSPSYYKFPNRCLCSVVRGNIGFAAIHYAFFPKGISATVDVKLYGKKIPAMVKGKIYARIGNLESSISYQEGLFKSILFYHVEDGVRHYPSDSTLPLVKSLVSLPVYSYLIIEVDLLVSPMDPVQGKLAHQGVISLKGNVGFTGNDDSPMQIIKDDLCIDVSVKFFDC